MDIYRSLRDADTIYRDFLAHELEVTSDVVHDELSLYGESSIHFLDHSAYERIVLSTLAQASQLIGIREEELAGVLSTILQFLSAKALRRELLVEERKRMLRASTQLRTWLAQYRSRKRSQSDEFASIEYVRDQLGNLFVCGNSTKVQCPTPVSHGQKMQFVVMAFDPLQDALEYRVVGERWQIGNILFSEVLVLSGEDFVQFHLQIRTDRKAERYKGYDDRVVFRYPVR